MMQYFLNVSMTILWRLDVVRLTFIDFFRTNPADNNMFKVDNRNTRARCEICSNNHSRTK